MAQINPYATPSGGPKEGQTAAWAAWNQERETERRETLSPEQRTEEDNDRRQLQRRMNAELPL
ncbi:hypothetical protein [Spirosoma areae]